MINKMDRLTSRDFHDILDLIHIASSHSELEEMREDTLHAMEPVFRIDSANFFLGDSRLRGIDITSAVSLGIDKHRLDQYLRHYYRYDPFRAELDSGKVVSRIDNVCPYSRLVKLGYYNDFLKPQKIHHEMVIYLRSGTKLLGVIALFRPKKHPNFSQMEVLKARMLSPHLTTVVENIRLFSKIEEKANLLRKANELPLQGVLLLDYKIRPVYWNSEAEEGCLSLSHKPNGANGIKSYDLPILPEIMQDCSTIKEIFESGSRIAPLSRVRTMYAGDGKRFQIKTSLAQQPSTEVSKPCFLVSLEDISETCKIRGEVLRERYHLTEREIEVVQSVSEGLTNEDVARRLFISRFTVENHLKSIFEKTGVKNRTELASRIEFP